MGAIVINGKPVSLADNDRLNVIQAAERAGIEIPHYCWHPALSVVASCRMCLVEVGEQRPDGSVSMQPRVIPACQTQAKPGMVVVTNSDKAKAAQAATLEYLLLNHPLDCPVCDQAGECYLQDYSYKFGRGYSRFKEQKLLRPDKDHIGRHIVLFTDRCVMCTRCVRFTREISGTSELQVLHRGDHAEIDIFPGKPCDNKLSGNVVDICPVGALCSRDFLYKQRVWFLKSTPSVCPGCSTGCSIVVDQHKDIVYRLRPRTNPKAQGWFMCDDGRFGFAYVNSADRLLSPAIRHGNRWLHLDWDEVLPTLRRRLEEEVVARPERAWMVISPWQTCEDAYLAARLFRQLSPRSRLALGPVPIVGEDDRYPKGVRGESPDPQKAVFTIRAEKCPNRIGVEAVLRHFQGEVIPFQRVVEAMRQDQVSAIYLLGGYPENWLDLETGKLLGGVGLVVIQDILSRDAFASATCVLPGAAFVEKDGTFVNHAGLAQPIRRAVKPPGEARSDAWILMALQQRPGLPHAPSLRAELAATIPFFAPLGDGIMDAQGVFLIQEGRGQNVRGG
jgi:NADH-quinone oxidoreductase subunit G